MPVKQNQTPAQLPAPLPNALATALGPAAPMFPPGVPKAAPAPILDPSDRVVQHALPGFARIGQTLTIYLTNTTQTLSWTLHSEVLDQKILSTIFNDQGGIYRWSDLWRALINIQVPLGVYGIFITYATSSTSTVIVSALLNITYF